MKQQEMHRNSLAHGEHDGALSCGDSPLLLSSSGPFWSLLLMDKILHYPL